MSFERRSRGRGGQLCQWQIYIYRTQGKMQIGIIPSRLQNMTLLIMFTIHLKLPILYNINYFMQNGNNREVHFIIELTHETFSIHSFVCRDNNNIYARINPFIVFSEFITSIFQALFKYRKIFYVFFLININIYSFDFCFVCDC